MRSPVVFCLAGLCLGTGGLTASAQGVPARGRAIQFSDPKVGILTSNLDSASYSRKASLRSLDEQLKANFSGLEASDPVGAANMPMPLLRTPSLSPKAARQLLEKKQEDEQWIFGSPEELEAQRLSAERMFGVTEFDESGAEASQKTPFQRYWDRAERERGGQTNRLTQDFTDVKTDQEIKDQARVMFGILNLATENAPEPPGAAATASALTPTYASPFTQEFSPMQSSAELFATPAATVTPQKNESAANRMSAFKQLFDIKPAGFTSAGGLGGASAAPLNRAASDYNLTPTPAWHSPAAAPVSSFEAWPGSSAARPAIGAPVSSLNPTPPVSLPPVRTISQPSGFQLPKRSF